MVTVRSETRDRLGEVVRLLVATPVVPRRMQPEMHGDPSKESCTSCTATGPPETLLDPLRGRQKIEAATGEEQVSGGEMG